MITAALILKWMIMLVPSCPHVITFPETADAIATVANEDSDPVNAAAYLVAIGFYESHFDPVAWSHKEDPTRSFGLFQLSVEWLELPASPLHQAKVALWLVRDSQKRCGSLAEYTSGKCTIGRDAAKDREALAKRLIEGDMPGVFLSRNCSENSLKRRWVQ